MHSHFRFVPAALLLVLAASLAVAQTTYSSPVRVTNTPLPVSGQVTVTGNTPVVNPNGVPLQVKAWDTIPVAQQGAVTVTPVGGTMPVSGSVAVTGTPQVILSGTPAVTLSGSDNKVEVRPAGAPFALQGDAQLPDGTLFSTYNIATVPSSGEYSEIEFVAARCGFETVARLWVADLGVTTPGGGYIQYPLPWASFLVRGTQEWYSAATPVKIYASPGSHIRINMQRSTGSNGWAKCEVSVSGRTY